MAKSKQEREAAPLASERELVRAELQAIALGRKEYPAESAKEAGEMRPPSLAARLKALELLVKGEALWQPDAPAVTPKVQIEVVDKP